jgi:uncharacterized membrane protein YfhO
LEDYVGKKPTRYAELEKENLELFNFLNIKYLLVLKYTSTGEILPSGQILDWFDRPYLEKVFENQTVAVLKNQQVLPRAMLLRENFLQAFELPEIAGLKDNQVPADINYREISGDSFGVDMNSEEPGLLLVTNLYFPGWQVLKDGQLGMFEKTTLPFMIVSVPAGEHKLLFKYQPDSYRMGMRVSLLGLGGLLALAYLWKRLNFQS